MSTSPGTWRRRSRSSSALTLLALLPLAAGAARAGAEQRVALAFERTRGMQTDVWVARADGSGARRLVRNAFRPRFSPDGRRLTYFVPRGYERLAILYVKTLATGATKRLGPAVQVTWAPRSRRLVLALPQALMLVDLKAKARRMLARGELCCAGFAPDGRALVYARGNGRPGRAFRSDVYAMRLADGRTTRLTRDRHSDRPVWGRGWIAYSHYRANNGWNIRDLRLMRPDGSGKRLLAAGHDDVSQAEMGIEPVAFSEDGTRLLACLAAEFHCPPVTFGLPGGRRHVPRVKRRGELAYGIAISRDGTQVLAEAGGLETPHRVVVAPFAGGTPRVLVRNATSPSWFR